MCNSQQFPYPLGTGLVWQYDTEETAVCDTDGTRQSTNHKREMRAGYTRNSDTEAAGTFVNMFIKDALHYGYSFTTHMAPTVVTSSTLTSTLPHLRSKEGIKRFSCKDLAQISLINSSAQPGAVVCYSPRAVGHRHDRSVHHHIYKI